MSPWEKKISFDLKDVYISNIEVPPMSHEKQTQNLPYFGEMTFENSFYQQVLTMEEDNSLRTIHDNYMYKVRGSENIDEQELKNLIEDKF